MKCQMFYECENEAVGEEDMPPLGMIAYCPRCKQKMERLGHKFTPATPETCNTYDYRS